MISDIRVVAEDEDMCAAIAGADALVIATKWSEFRQPDFARLACALKDRLIVDGRNLYDRRTLSSLGVECLAIGKGSAAESVDVV